MLELQEKREPQVDEEDERHRRRAKLIIGGIALAVILAFAILVRLAFTSRPTVNGLPDATRAGSAEFDAYAPKLAFEEKEIIVHPNLIGMAQYEVRLKLTNRGDRTLTGLELLGSIILHDDKIVARNISVPIPRLKKVLAPGESMRVSVKVDAPGNVSEGEIKDVSADLRGLRLQ